MDEQNPNAVPDDSDYESYLSILQKMQDSLPEEEVSASAAQLNESDDDFPTSSTLLATAELSSSAVLEPDFDVVEAPVQDVLMSNGHSHSFDSDWGAMPTQPLSLPSDYFNGSSFAQYDAPIEVPNSEEMDVPAPSFDEDDSFAEMEAPTDFALSVMQSDMNGTAEAYAPPLEIDEDEYEEPATQLLQPISPEIAAQFAHSANGNTHSVDESVEMLEGDDFALPTTMLVQEDVNMPEPDFASESVVENEFDEFATQPLPDIMFALNNNSVEETVEEPEMLLVETPELTAEDKAPALEVDETEPQSEADEFEMPEMLDALPTPMAFSDFSNAETALPEPESLQESLDEFPSFIGEADEFPESLDSASEEAEEFEAPFAPAFESFDVPTVLPNDFTNNGKYDYAAESAESVTTHVDVDSSAFLEDRYIVFKIDEAHYAFSAKSVAEIGQPLPVTPLPFVPSWFLGISNLRGDILSVVGLRELWGKKSTPSQQRTKLLVVRSERQGVTVGLVVDAVREMRRVSGGEISAAKQTEEHLSSYKLGEVNYDGQRLSLLDAEKFLETLKG